MDRFFFIKKNLLGPRCYIFQIRSTQHHSVDQGDSEEATQAQGLGPLHLWTSGVQCGLVFDPPLGPVYLKITGLSSQGWLIQELWIFCVFFRTHPPNISLAVPTEWRIRNLQDWATEMAVCCGYGIAIAMILLGFTGGASASRDFKDSFSQKYLTSGRLQFSKCGKCMQMLLQVFMPKQTLWKLWCANLMRIIPYADCGCYTFQWILSFCKCPPPQKLHWDEHTLCC